MPKNKMHKEEVKLKKTKISKAASLLLSLMLVLTLIPSAGAEMAFAAEGETETSTAAEYVSIYNENGGTLGMPDNLSSANPTWSESDKGKATFSNADGKSTLTLKNYNYYPISASGGDITLVLSGKNTITGAQEMPEEGYNTSTITGLTAYQTGVLTIKGDTEEGEDSLTIDLTGNEKSNGDIHGIFAKKIVIDGNVSVTVNVKGAKAKRYALYAKEGIEIKNGATLTISFDKMCSTNNNEYAIYNDTSGDIVIDNATVNVETAKAKDYHYSIYNMNGGVKIKKGSKVTLDGCSDTESSEVKGYAIENRDWNVSSKANQCFIEITGSGTKVSAQNYFYAIYDDGVYNNAQAADYGIEVTDGAELDISNCNNGIRSHQGVKVSASTLTVKTTKSAVITTDSPKKSLDVFDKSNVELQSDESSALLQKGENGVANFNLSTGGCVTLRRKNSTDIIKNNLYAFKLGENTTYDDPSKYAVGGEKDKGYYLLSDQPETWVADSGYYSIKFVPNKILTAIRVSPVEGLSEGDTPTLAVPTTATATGKEIMAFKATGTYGSTDTADITDSVAWSVTTTADGTIVPNGVSINQNGILTVTPEAEAGNVYIKAESGDVSSEAFTLTLVKGTSVASAIKFFRGAGTDEAEVGEENGEYTDTIYIPTTGSTTVNYSAKAYDQYGAEIATEGFTWTNRKLYNSAGSETTSDKVEFLTSGQPGITVTKDADEVKATMTATVMGTDVSKTLTVYVKNKKEVEIKGVTAKTDLVYNGEVQEGYTGTPTYSPAWRGTLTTAYYLADGTTKTTTDNSGAAGEGQAPKNAGTYKVKFAIPDDDPSCKGSAELDFTIAQKEVTVEAGSYKVSKVYDGTTDAGTGSEALAVSGILDADAGVNVKATPAAYTNANVGGQTTMDVTIVLDGTGKENYKIKDNATTVNVPCEITPATLIVEGTATATATYGTQVKDITISGLTAKLNGTEVEGTWSFSSTVIPDAGTDAEYTASFTPTTGADNYNELTTKIKPSITKASRENKAASGEAKYGAEGTVDLSSYIVEGGTATVYASSVSEEASVLVEAPSITEDNKLKFKFKNDSTLADTTDTITVEVTSKNYNNYYVTVVVKVLSKTANPLTVSNKINAVYGDTEVKLNPSDAIGDVTYRVASGAGVISVANDGKITINKAGTAKVEVTAAGDATYASKTVEVTVAITKRKITVKANDKTMTVNGALPAFDVAYGNLAAADTKDTVIETEAVAGVAAGVDGKTAGSFDITIMTEPTLKTGMDDKYEFETQKGTLTVNAAAAGGAIGGGGGALPLPTPEKPEITIDNTQGKLELSADGATASITANEGYEIEKVTVNGVDKGAVNKLTGLKTGDKVVVSFKSTAPAADDSAALETIKEKVAKLQFMARSSKTSKKNVKLTLKFDSKTSAEINEFKSLGYTVKYKFYRSTKKSKGYKAVLTKTSKTYTNTKGVKGTKYYYKARVQVFDKDGKLVAQTELKQCRYASRTWTK